MIRFLLSLSAQQKRDEKNVAIIYLIVQTDVMPYRKRCNHTIPVFLVCLQ